MQPLDPGLGALAQLVERPELDRLGGAGLGAGRLLALLEAVVAQGALEDPAIVLALVDDAVGAGGDAVAAAVADVGLHDDRTELGAEQCTGRAHVKARGVRAVLAHVRRHQPAHGHVTGVGGLRVRRTYARHAQISARARSRVGSSKWLARRQRRLAVVVRHRVVAERRHDGRRLLDEGDMSPAVGVELLGVVVRHSAEQQPVLGNAVPLLACHLARLAADADAGVGEEAHPLRRVLITRFLRDLVQRSGESVPHACSLVSVMPARSRYSLT